MMTGSPAELAQQERFEAVYARSQDPVMLAIERQVCGCAYGGNSWTTRSEAEQISTRLGLRAGMRLLDLGAGAGWPGLYLAKVTACEVVLVDLPLSGLRIAARRAVEDGLADRVCVAAADAADLPLPAASVDAISHSDLLCCLEDKRAVLTACRAVIRPKGTMVFTVISVAPGLSAEQHRRAVANGPDFIEAETDYPTLLAETGWRVTDRDDLTKAYADSCQRQLAADQAHKDALAALIGKDAVTQRRADWRAKLAILSEALLRRERYLAVPNRVQAI